MRPKTNSLHSLHMRTRFSDKGKFMRELHLIFDEIYFLFVIAKIHNQLKCVWHTFLSFSQMNMTDDNFSLSMLLLYSIKTLFPTNILKSFFKTCSCLPSYILTFRMVEETSVSEAQCAFRMVGFFFIFALTMTQSFEIWEKEIMMMRQEQYSLRAIRNLLEPLKWVPEAK